jgi:hypothetical protein
MRGLMAESFNLSRKEALAAMRRRWGSTRHVQDMVELFAKLEGELTKEAGEEARGVQIILLNNQGASPLDPEVFREAARRKVLEESGHTPSGGRAAGVHSERDAGRAL